MTTVLDPVKKESTERSKMMHIVDEERSTPELLVGLCGYKGGKLEPDAIEADCIVCQDIWDNRLNS